MLSLSTSKISLVLEPRDLLPCPFWPHPSKTIDVTWVFCISISMPKISLLHPFILEIQPIVESQHQSGHIHFWQCIPKHFWVNLQFSWICTHMQKTKLFHYLSFWKYSWFKNPAIWLAKSILVHIYGARFLKRFGTCARI